MPEVAPDAIRASPYGLGSDRVRTPSTVNALPGSRPIPPRGSPSCDRLALVPEDSPRTSDWREAALFTVVDVESAVARAGQVVYGNDSRLDHLVRETRRLLEQRRHGPT
jgi:hypothetical protein